MKLMISCEQVQLRLLSRFIVSSPFLGGGGSLIEKTDSLLIGLVGRTFKQQNMLNGTESYFSRFGAVGCIRKSRMDVCATQMIAELLCGRRPQKWSPIPILRGMLVIFYGHGKRNGSRARAPYIHTYIRTYIAFHDILT